MEKKEGREERSEGEKEEERRGEIGSTNGGVIFSNENILDKPDNQRALSANPTLPAKTLKKKMFVRNNPSDSDVRTSFGFFERTPAESGGATVSFFFFLRRFPTFPLWLFLSCWFQPLQ